MKIKKALVILAIVFVVLLTLNDVASVAVNTWCDCNADCETVLKITYLPCISGYGTLKCVTIDNDRYKFKTECDVECNCSAW